ncbi:1-(5-phosphoribosyl)-5-[(5-phosphoribosylamino)methylideneamino] imidazole-4-carboxamide isomerase [uncultured bacterium]|nr:1-(5-phosphoribosyl)-5-[(5-phosphoribosylamino)methylideneamino] imidazole-4-carboxamide isomerase [uncultured bacterium]
MNLIPVIDLKEGYVVHAQRGLRESYQPLQPTADIFFVIEKFLALHDFKKLYIADLNAIMKQGNNFALIEKILQHYPQIEFWLDCGQPIQLTANNYLTVLASEWCSVETLKQIEHYVLSLDFSAKDEPLGDIRLFNDNSLWSKQVIIMTLARVGSDLGVDIEKLQNYRSKYPNTEFVASGGVRHLADLKQLQTLGISHVLMASALHSGTINKSNIDCL